MPGVPCKNVGADCSRMLLLCASTACRAPLREGWGSQAACPCLWRGVRPLRNVCCWCLQPSHSTSAAHCTGRGLDAEWHGQPLCLCMLALWAADCCGCCLSCGAVLQLCDRRQPAACIELTAAVVLATGTVTPAAAGLALILLQLFALLATHALPPCPPSCCTNCSGAARCPAPSHASAAVVSHAKTLPYGSS